MYCQCFKRIFDFTIAALVLSLLSPLFLLLYLLVRFKLGSPVFFKQQRPGLNEKPFLLIQIPYHVRCT